MRIHPHRTRRNRPSSSTEKSRCFLDDVPNAYLQCLALRCANSVPMCPQAPRCLGPGGSRDRRARLRGGHEPPGDPRRGPRRPRRRLQPPRCASARACRGRPGPGRRLRALRLRVARGARRRDGRLARGARRDARRLRRLHAPADAGLPRPLRPHRQHPPLAAARVPRHDADRGRAGRGGGRDRRYRPLGGRGRRHGPGHRPGARGDRGGRHAGRAARAPARRRAPPVPRGAARAID